MWHLTTTNYLHHQRLLNCFKFTTHYDLVVVALLDDELQTIFLPEQMTYLFVNVKDVQKPNFGSFRFLKTQTELKPKGQTRNFGFRGFSQNRTELEKSIPHIPSKRGGQER